MGQAQALRVTRHVRRRHSPNHGDEDYHDIHLSLAARHGERCYIASSLGLQGHRSDPSFFCSFLSFEFNTVYNRLLASPFTAMPCYAITK